MAAPIAASCSFESEFEEYKLRRAEQRSRSCYKKQVDFKRACDARAARSTPPRRDEPHGARRSAARTCLARGAVEVDTDMPAVAGGHRAAKSFPQRHLRKASVSPLLKAAASPALSQMPTDIGEDDLLGRFEEFDEELELPPSVFDVEQQLAEEEDEEEDEASEDELEKRAIEIQMKADKELRALKQSMEQSRARTQSEEEELLSRFAAQAAAKVSECTERVASVRAPAVASARPTQSFRVALEGWESLPDNSPQLEASADPEGDEELWEFIL